MSPSLVGNDREPFRASDDIYSFAMTALVLAQTNSSWIRPKASWSEDPLTYIKQRHNGVKKLLKKGDISRPDGKCLSSEFRQILRDMIENVDKSENREEDIGVYLKRLVKLGPENFLFTPKFTWLDLLV